MSAAVVSTSVIGSAATTIQRGRGSVPRQPADLVAERARVGEEQRRVEAEDHQPGQLLGPRDGGRGRGSRRRSATRPRAVWYGHQDAAEHVQDRQRDGDGDAGQHAEQRDAEERGDREHELGAPLSPAAGACRRCRRATATRRSPPRRASAAAGCAAGRARGRSISRIAAAPDQSGDLRLRAGLLGHRGPRAAGADREALEERRRAMLAAPMPIISRLPSTSSPVRAANADAVEIVSVSETSAMPSAPANEQRQVAERHVRDGERREALGQRADERDAVVREVEHDAAAIDSTTATSTPGTLGSTRCRTRISDQADASPIASAAPHRLAVGTPSTKPRASSIRPSASTEKPNSFGSWPTRIVSARPFM